MQFYDNKIVIELPLTTPTGKARVKRRSKNFGIPISTKKENLTDKEYIEWQISYFLTFEKIWEKFRKKNSEAARKQLLIKLFYQYKNEDFMGKIKNLELDKKFKKKEFILFFRNFFNKNSEDNEKNFIYYELSDIIKFALNKSIINKKEINELIKFNAKKNIEDAYKIKIKNIKEKIYNFDLYDEIHPLFLSEINKESFIEINLKHKQSAVGYQAMLYFCYYLKYAKDSENKSVIGRKAKTKEKVKIFLSKKHLIEITKAFMLISKKYSSEIKEVLKNLIAC